MGGGEFASSLKPSSLFWCQRLFWVLVVAPLVFSLFSCGRLRACLRLVRLGLESFPRVRRQGAMPCEAWQRGCCDMQHKKTGKLHSTFLVRAVVGDLFERVGV